MTLTNSPFEIRYTPSNRTGSLPGHWDILLNGQDDAICTVWDSEAMAREIVAYLEAYPQRSNERAAQARAS